MGFIVLMTMAALAALAIIGFVVGNVLATRQKVAAPLNRAERLRLRAAEAAIENVKELAYEYRDLDSNLSYRLLDTVRDYEDYKREALEK